MTAADTAQSAMEQSTQASQSPTHLDVSSSVLSPPADYLYWCVRVGADLLAVEALQEWDYLHSDEMTEAEHRTATAWAVGLDLYSAA
ncbi:hypothetical protein [Rhodococcus sp. H29-C3]|uniref:hypothetical protein n=1 Tax=Rhodococcus sp. H29-C3 TaxID=3046307 RepID=UPI0024BB23FB|nr:hypothetical protein [Rhodococcus sp. H29-C3]MDJ0363241.1 hypothetical protein [Rhodococcus sp. H29-C3]